MERDWLPTLANISADARHRVSYDLTHLNTITRRIDMLCKLIAPLAVSTLVSKIGSERLAAIVVAAISTLSLGPEFWGAQTVWYHNSRLRARKVSVDEITTRGDQTESMQLSYKTRSSLLASMLYGKVVSQVMDSIRAYVADLGYYFRTSVWIPSLCAAIPHASVLTFSGTMLTYLLNAGYSLDTITGARANGAVFEMASTFIFPWAVGIFSTSKILSGRYYREGYQQVEQRESPSRADASLNETYNDQTQCSESSRNIEQSVIRVGSWALGGLLLTLVSPNAAPTVFSRFSERSTPTNQFADPRRNRPLLSRCTLHRYRHYHLRPTSISHNILSPDYYHPHPLHFSIPPLPLDLRPLRHPVDSGAGAGRQTLLVRRDRDVDCQFGQSGTLDRRGGVACSERF